MKIFLSWSGSESHRVALILRDWLPSVIQSVVPYVSSEDIDKGTRWSTDIAKELEDSSFGILCVTKDNLEAAWLNFEAGALSKTMDKSRVCPFLFNIKRSEVNGPVLQFQSTIFDKEDVLKLLKVINKSCGEFKLTEDRLTQTYEVWYPTLEKQLTDLVENNAVSSSNNIDKNAKNETDILEEILELSRINQKLLRNPKDDSINILKEMNERLEYLFRIIRDKNDDNRLHIKERNKDFYYFIDDMTREFARTDPFTRIRVMFSPFREINPAYYEMGVVLIDRAERAKTEESKKRHLNMFYEFMRRYYKFVINDDDMYDMRKIIQDFDMMFSEF